jgi:glutamate---cysteine ligase / carboxylate-amine ligase
VEHQFGKGEPFTVGAEEELFLVDPDTHALVHDAAEVLAAMEAGEPQAGHEAYACELELRSPPLRSAGEAAVTLRALRQRAAGAGATLLGAGIHPQARFGDVELVDAERYRRVADQMRGLFRRTPECALHVHVGTPDADTAVRAFNGLRAHLPLFQGLSANSPWWFGADSGLASARFSLVRAFPGRGVPPSFSSFDEYAELVQSVTEAGGLDDYTFVWWDLRLQPRLGTIEIREMDSQSSLERVAALAALAQGLALHEAEHPRATPPSQVIAESSFRASRDGLDASILDDGSMRPLREVARDALELARPHARERDSADALEGIERILLEGDGAARQRAAFERGGISAVLEMLVSETAA